MFGYRLQKPTVLSTSAWACKTVVSDYEWKNNHSTDILEISMATAKKRTVQIGTKEPQVIDGTTISCIIGGFPSQSYADTGVAVEILSVAVRFKDLTAEAKEFDDEDFSDCSVLLIPSIVQELSERELSEYERLLNLYVQSYVNTGAGAELLCNAIIFDLLCRLDSWVRQQASIKSERYTNYYIQKVDAIICRRYAQKITLQEIAKELSITPNYLSSLYKNTRGIGFSQALTEIRLKKARELLISTSLSAAEIAEQTGLGDESTLRRRFKQCFGASIREYRCIAKEQTLYHEKPLRKNTIKQS